MKYVIEYEQLKDELVTNDKTRVLFNRVRNYANKYRIELSDEEFKTFFALGKNDHTDIRWMISKMGMYDVPFVDVLVSYIQATA